MRGLGFTLGDIPVRVDVTFWIIMGLFGLQRATAGGGLDAFLVVEWIVLVFVGILLHELGHAVSFRAFGRKPSVVLYGMGGLTSAAGALSPGRRLVTTLAGPGVGFVLGGLVLALRASGVWDLPRLDGLALPDLMRVSLGAAVLDISRAEVIFLDLLFITIGGGLLNLVPLYPLDGGQSVEALLALLRVRRAERITSMIGVVVASGIGVVAVRTGEVFLLLIMVFLGLANVRRLGALSRPPATASGGGAAAVPPELQRSLAMAEQALSQGQPEQAVELLRQEHTLRPSPQSARAYLAVLARTRRFEEVEALVRTDAERIDAATMASAGAALVAGGRYEAALFAAEAAWTTDADGAWQPAVVAAAARAGLRDVDGAIRWLYTAADRGWDDRRRLEGDPIFAEVRADPRLPDVLARMGV
jgi:stage IV sporulation protein FB